MLEEESLVIEEVRKLLSSSAYDGWTSRGGDLTSLREAFKAMEKVRKKKKKPATELDELVARWNNIRPVSETSPFDEALCPYCGHGEKNDDED